MKQTLGVIYDDKKMELAISSYEEKSISIDNTGLLKDDFKDRLKAYKVLTNKIREVISDKKIKHVGLLKDASNKYYNKGNFPSENEILHHILNSQKNKLKLSSLLYENLTGLYKSAKIYGDSHKKRLNKLNSKYAIDSKISEQKSSELVSVLILLSQYKIPAA